MNYSLLYLIILIPAVSAAVLLLGGKLTDSWGHLLGTAAPIASFAIAVSAFIKLDDNRSAPLTQHLYTWFSAGDPSSGYTVNFDLQFDQLSALFVLLITGVGSLIHLYSIGYMAHDERRRRFFGYMNLFVAAMLTLVLSNDYLTLFLGWEGVGLASYLLIGFWQHKDSAAVGAKKAFIVNRVGDMGLALAIMLMFATFGGTSFATVNAGIDQASSGTATALGLLLLLGACGKSAQVPLQSWLLDAMEGPTPVSALIHAATMVTAGVYLVVRSDAIYNDTPDAQTVVVIVGVVTLLWGAIIGCAKDDIKKVLAGSTMSQIGYMMLAAGVGPAGYAFAIFHLLTHGFFKADMFLGAGSVMHAMDDEVNMRRYGALWRVLPITFITFACGYLAIIGIPPLSGFWSKDHIIIAGFTDNVFVGLAAMLGAGITGFYMTRLMIMTFFSQKRWAEKAHPHESPPVMTIPLMILAAGAVFGGVLIIGNWIEDWLAPVIGPTPEPDLAVPDSVIEIGSLVVVLIGVAIAYLLFGREDVPNTAPQRVTAFTRAARADLYGDAFNEAVFMRPGEYLTRSLVFFDNRRIDGAVNGIAALIGGTSGRIRRFQNGFVRSYALSMLGGAAAVVLVMLAVRFA